MDTTHLHLLLNHVPTIGFIVALSFFVVSFIGKSDHIKQASLTLMVGIAFITIPTYVTGNAAWNAIQTMDDMKESAVETHEGAAFLAMMAIQITGALAFLGLWSMRRTGSLSHAATAVIFIFCLVSFALVAGAANLGGEIRHTEIRPEVESVTAIGPFARTIGNYVRDTPWTWVTAETLHFVGLTLLIGVLTVIALRMLGFMVGLPSSVLMRLLPWGMVGYAINTMTGMLFFAAAPQQYLDNPAFYWKLIFLMLGRRQRPLLHVRCRLAAWTRARRAAALEAPGGVGALPVGGRHVLGQHAAVHRQRLLGDVTDEGTDVVGCYRRVGGAERHARGRVAGISGAAERRTSRFAKGAADHGVL